MNITPLTAIDFYKADHRRQYPEKTTSVYSNFTPRSTKHAPHVEGFDDKIVCFGLQYFIKWFLIEEFNKNFFNLPKEQAVAKYKRRLDTALGPNAVPVDHITELHELGFLPIVIKALPEGATVNAKIPIFTVKETNERFSWLTNYLETIDSCMNWMPCTSATIARKYRQVLNKFALETGGDLNFVQFQGHDFSFRGQSSYQSAVMSGAAHLLSFTGTDTVAAIDFLEDYYNANAEKELIGCSVPATEHSVMTMSGPDGELNIFKRLITELYPKGIISIVSDSFDFWQVVTEFLPKLKPQIIARIGGFPIDKVVIRPDSGDPVKIICGYTEEEVIKIKGKIYLLNGPIILGQNTPGDEITEFEFKGCVECLWDTFGGTVTDKGYKVLDTHIGLIYGDSITLERAYEILTRLKNKGFASTNVVLGIGSFTYQYVTRDTLGFAMKATAGVVNGQFREIFKDPKTDGGGMKKSAKGLLRVDLVNGEYVLKDQCTPEEEAGGELKEVFRDGKLLIDWTLAEIRARVAAGL